MKQTLLKETDQSTTYPNVHYFEQPPQDHWIIESKGPEGQAIYYFRFQATGVKNRRFGPFSSKEAAMEGLDCLIDKLLNAFIDAETDLKEEVVTFPFHKRWDVMEIEEPYTFHRES